jgi:hypothetical protein
MNLKVSDRITVTYRGAKAVEAAIAQFADYVAGETLATRLVAGEPGPGAFNTSIDDQAFSYRIELAGK